MANYQITNRTGAQIKAVLDNFSTPAQPRILSSISSIIMVDPESTFASGTLWDIAHGQNVETNGIGAYAGGIGVHATHNGAHAEGSGTTAAGEASHAEGGSYKSDGTSANSVALGDNNVTYSVLGPYTVGVAAHAEGSQTLALGNISHTEGLQTVASGLISHAEGEGSKALGEISHAEGRRTEASGRYGSHAEGNGAIASGASAHAEGFITTASGDFSYAGGTSTTASGMCSHAEGYNTTASGDYSHTEGTNTTASVNCSHAEGDSCSATGRASHAEGSDTQAKGYYSHAGGLNTIAEYDSNTAIGKYNTNDINAPFLVGNGLLYNGTAKRWSSFWINWQGWLNVSPYGSITNGTISQATTGNSWIDATHSWNIAAPANAALNLWDVPNEGGFHTWIRQRTANYHYVMGVIPSNGTFYVAANPSGANPSTNAISKMLFWNASNGSLGISGTYSSGSDRRLKNILGNTTNEETLAILKNVNIVNFNYKYDYDLENNIRNGIIAQDLQQILKEHNIEKRAYLTTINVPRNEGMLTFENDEGEEEYWDENEMTKEFLGISYVDLVPILIKGWQIHEQKIQELEARIEELENK